MLGEAEIGEIQHSSGILLQGVGGSVGRAQPKYALLLLFSQVSGDWWISSWPDCAWNLLFFFFLPKFNLISGNLSHHAVPGASFLYFLPSQQLQWRVWDVRTVDEKGEQGKVIPIDLVITENLGFLHIRDRITGERGVSEESGFSHKSPDSLRIQLHSSTKTASLQKTKLGFHVKIYLGNLSTPGRKESSNMRTSFQSSSEDRFEFHVTTFFEDFILVMPFKRTLENQSTTFKPECIKNAALSPQTPRGSAWYWCFKGERFSGAILPREFLLLILTATSFLGIPSRTRPWDPLSIIYLPFWLRTLGCRQDPPPTKRPRTHDLSCHHVISSNIVNLVDSDNSIVPSGE